MSVLDGEPPSAEVPAEAEPDAAEEAADAAR